MEMVEERIVIAWTPKSSGDRWRAVAAAFGGSRGRRRSQPVLCPMGDWGIGEASPRGGHGNPVALERHYRAFGGT